MVLTDAVVQQYGVLGIILVLVAHLAYNVYENRRGVIHDLHTKVYTLSVLEYRRAARDPDDDEEMVRDALFNGGEIVFPRDFDENP